MIWLHSAVLMLATAGGGDAVLLDFYTDGCMPCRQMMPAVEQLRQQGYPVRKVHGGRDPATASRYGVGAFPTFVMVLDGREIDRVVGATSYDRLLQMFRKADAVKAKSQPRPPADMPPAMPSSPDSGAMLPAVPSGPLGGRQAGPAVPVSFESGSASGRPAPGWVPASRTIAEGGEAREGGVPASTVTAAGAGPVSDATLIASSVRLRVEDPNGHSCGSGTIIDTRSGWALILTCGHLFRDSQGKGRIDVELFGPGGSQKVRGELVGYDSEKRDLGLLRIRVPSPVCVAPVAPRDYEISVGDRVASVGCSHGADPTVQRTTIRAKDKFVGPPNLQAHGLPVEGRSGGGLFSSEGYVIGVCNAADPTDNAGLYAALASIQAELDRMDLTYVYQRPSGPPSGRWAPAPGAPQTELVDVRPPGMPAKMPAPAALADAGSGFPVPTSSRHTAPQQFAPPAPPSSLSPEEQAALEEIRRRKAQGAEVICIIRPANDPEGKSEILRLEGASPAFLQQLTAEASRR